MKRTGVIAALAALSLVSTVRLDARAEPPPPKDWEVEILPYAWLPSLDGSFETPHRGTEHIHVTVSEILEDLSLAAMGRVSVRWHRWLLVADGLWSKLEEDADFAGSLGGRIDGDFEQQMALAQALAGYRVYSRPGGLFGTATPGDERVFGIDLLGGINYNYLSADVELDLAPVGAIPGGQRHFGISKKWVAPAVGLRFHNDLTSRVRLETLGVLGGFSVSDAPELSWQLTTLLSYRFTDHWLASLGHRLIAADDGEYDLKLHGLILGVGYRF